MNINFYREGDDYGFCSNFYRSAVKIDGKEFRTTEHYFQAMKFATTDPEAAERVRRAYTPSEAARLGRSRRFPLRHDWESVKDDIMRRALQAKFMQHPELRRQLLATGDAALVEHTRNDAYWGDGGNGKGKNMLGKLLMELRENLKQQQQQQQQQRQQHD